MINLLSLFSLQWGAGAGPLLAPVSPFLVQCLAMVFLMHTYSSHTWDNAGRRRLVDIEVCLIRWSLLSHWVLILHQLIDVLIILFIFVIYLRKILLAFGFEHFRALAAKTRLWICEIIFLANRSNQCVRLEIVESIWGAIDSKIWLKSVRSSPGSIRGISIIRHPNSLACNMGFSAGSAQVIDGLIRGRSRSYTIFHVDVRVETCRLLTNDAAIARCVQRVLIRAERQPILPTSLPSILILFIVGVRWRHFYLVTEVCENALCDSGKGDFWKTLMG